MSYEDRSFGKALRESRFLRLVVIGLQALALLVPVGWISGLIDERRMRRDEAVKEVMEKWGGEQTILGPTLMVPSTVDGVVTRELIVLPENLLWQAKIDGQIRYRGIYAVPVYRVVLDVSGVFRLPVLPKEQTSAVLDWERAYLSLGVTDARTIQGGSTVTWDSKKFDFEPGELESGSSSQWIHAPLANPFSNDTASFSLRLVVDGSDALYFTAAGRETVATIDSTWSNPSFQGTWLPDKHEESSQGFSASWTIPFLGRSHSRNWQGRELERNLIGTRFGVALHTAVDQHRMAERSVKYALLFLLLTFGAIWLIEVLTALRLHPIQYLLIGSAECLFYLLELSLSEQVGFPVAYLIASAAIVGLISFYSASVLHSMRRALGVSSTLLGLYLCLYVLLTNEDYALLLGSIGLFLGLGVTMYLTRGIDWYQPIDRSDECSEVAHDVA